MIPFTNAASPAAYLVLAALVAAESAGVPLPGETSLIAASILASDGRLDLPVVIVVAAAAAIVGDNVGYLIGRRGGRWLLERRGRWQRGRRRMLARGEAFFERHGGKAVFLARWAPGVRVTGAWLAGATGMRWPRFLAWNASGGITWAATVGLSAYLVGQTAAAVFGVAGIALLVVAAVVALVAAALRRRRAWSGAAARGPAGTRSGSAPAAGPAQTCRRRPRSPRAAGEPRASGR